MYAGLSSSAADLTNWEKSEKPIPRWLKPARDDKNRGFGRVLKRRTTRALGLR
jgi:hypothetical protein